MEESLLYPITVVDVDVNVQHASVMFQQLCIKMSSRLLHRMFNHMLYNLQDGQDNVINIAEATGLPSLCMVKSSRPVDCHLGGAKDHKEEELVDIGQVQKWATNLTIP